MCFVSRLLLAVVVCVADWMKNMKKKKKFSGEEGRQRRERSLFPSCMHSLSRFSCDPAVERWRWNRFGRRRCCAFYALNMYREKMGREEEKKRFVVIWMRGKMFCLSLSSSLSRASDLPRVSTPFHSIDSDFSGCRRRRRKKSLRSVCHGKKEEKIRKERSTRCRHWS